MKIFFRKEFVCDVAEAKARHIINELKINKMRSSITDGVLVLKNKKALEVVQELL